jgi:peptidoglycan hydrolase-like protein with peptidoglycan-binding domain
MTSVAKSNKPKLEEGARGEVVKELQKLLYDNGAYALNCNYGVPEAFIDGVFGSDTTGAVRAFQSQMFLTADGIVGDTTWLSLFQNAPVNMPILRKGSKGELVSRVQERLTISGDYKATIDGDFGDMTVDAVKSLQKRLKLSVDGDIGSGTWLELSKVSQVEGC